MMLDRMMLTQKQLGSGTVASSGNPATGSAQSAFEVAGDVITPPHDTIDWAHQRMIGHINADPAEKRLPSAVLKITVWVIDQLNFSGPTAYFAPALITRP